MADNGPIPDAFERTRFVPATAAEEGVCRTCDGTGRLGRAACPDCQGTGRAPR